MSVEQHPYISYDDQLDRIVDTQNVSYDMARQMLGEIDVTEEDVLIDIAVSACAPAPELSLREQRRQEDHATYHTIYRQTGNVQLTPSQRASQKSGYSAISKVIQNHFSKKA